ncbi:MAG: hypothetical protein K0S44_1214 [Bacteroidetes bacterium]|jgi:hypothetical protein|nr:hypothetical protein [Bacteroidota bacterium]
MDTQNLDLNNDMDKEHMKTLVSCTNSLLAKGYETQFKAMKHGLKSLTTEKIYTPDQVKITNFYRFEGDSDPSDSSILYAIETTSGEKGTLTDAYGAYSDPHVAKFIKDVEDIGKREHKNSAG